MHLLAACECPTAGTACAATTSPC